MIARESLTMSKHVIPDQVLSRPEPLSEAERLARVPATPFAFIRFLVGKHFRARVAILVALAGTALASATGSVAAVAVAAARVAGMIAVGGVAGAPAGAERPGPAAERSQPARLAATSRPSRTRAARAGVWFMA